MPPVPLAIQYPLINGHRFSFASLEVTFNGIPVLGIKSMNYSDELMPGEIYGSAPQKLGETRGKQKASCDFEMYRLEWEVLRATLGAAGLGYGETRFLVQVAFFEIGAPVVMDTIIGTRVNKVESSNSDGTDGSIVKVSCSALRVMMNSKDSIAAPIKIGI